MGRGRAKAKQTKVARELKYSSGGTDLERLQRELANAPSAGPVVEVDDTEDDDDADPYAKYADDDED